MEGKEDENTTIRRLKNIFLTFYFSSHYKRNKNMNHLAKGVTLHVVFLSLGVIQLDF